MHDLDDQLRALSDDLEWPDETAIADVVRARLAGPRRRDWGIGWKAAAAAVVVIGVALSIAPVRDRVADALSILGITIRQVEETAAEPGGPLDLGEAVSLAEAESRTVADFFIADVGRPPDAVYVDDSVAGGMVSLVWEPDEQFPEVEGTDVGLLTSHFLGDGVTTVKSLGPDTRVEAVTVDGLRGWWIAGAPHDVEGGPGSADRLRLAANVLVWTDGDTTHRVETAADLDTVLAVVAGRG